MDWTYLGHAAWLAEAGRLRMLFDPILDDPHQGGTCAVWPPRRIEAEALRPDFLLISHRHPDHFDVRSMARLAKLDPDTVVLTPDPLVAHVARELGFRVVRQLDAGLRIQLDAVRLTLTPSRSPDPEWGVVVETEEGTAWNQVDTLLDGPDEVRRVVQSAADGRGIDLALVRWAPLLEIDAQIPGSLAFPFDAYDAILTDVAAIGARSIVPSASGQRNLTGAWLDRVAFPVTIARACGDLALRCPATAVLPPHVGGCYRVRGGKVTLDVARRSELVSVSPDPGPDPRVFAPLTIPAIVDRSQSAEEPELRARISIWVHTTLVPALEAATMPPPAGRPIRLGLDPTADQPLRLGLEVVFPSGPHGWTFTRAAGAVSIRAGLEPDLDVLDVISASALLDVIDMRRSWGHVLLAGELRASARAYRVTAQGLRRIPVSPTFLYHALSYEESERRVVLRELAAVKAGRPPPWDDRGCPELSDPAAVERSSGTAPETADP